MKKVKKNLIKIILILIVTVFSMATYSFARIDTSNVQISNTYIRDFETPGNKILGIVEVVGIICAVIGLMIIGIRYMTGSIEEKAEYKKTLPYYLLGMVLIGAITPLVKLILEIVKDISSTI